MEETSGADLGWFFQQWVYRAGAPRFEVRDSYDAAAHMVTLDVQQTQKLEGQVGLFDVPVTVEITTANGRRSYPIEVSRAAMKSSG